MKGKGPVFIVLFSLFIGAGVVLVSFLPELVISECQHEYKESPQELSTYFSTSDNWKDWLFYLPKEEKKYIQNGPLQGKGASFKWFCDKEGDGVVEITAVSKESVNYQLVTDNGQFRNRGRFLFKKGVLNTKVVWQDTLDVSTSVFARWAARKGSFEDRITAKNKSVLNKIENLIKGGKNRKNAENR